MSLLRNLESESGQASSEGGKLARYEDDAYTWALQQADALRAGRLADLDVTNLADEIAAVAGREYDKLESALTRVIQHLLKWDHQPARRSRSWALSIDTHRLRVRRQLRKHPGLKGTLADALLEAYEDGRNEALLETDLSRRIVPDTLPYTFDEIMNREIVWPED